MKLCACRIAMATGQLMQYSHLISIWIMAATNAEYIVSHQCKDEGSLSGYISLQWLMIASLQDMVQLIGFRSSSCLYYSKATQLQLSCTLWFLSNQRNQSTMINSANLCIQCEYISRSTQIHVTYISSNLNRSRYVAPCGNKMQKKYQLLLLFLNCVLYSKLISGNPTGAPPTDEVNLLKYMFQHCMPIYLYITQYLPTQGPHSNGETPDPMLMNCNEFSALADINCPLHPATNDLPCPLSQGVTNALQLVEKHLLTVLNSTNVVCWLIQSYQEFYSWLCI